MAESSSKPATEKAKPAAVKKTSTAAAKPKAATATKKAAAPKTAAPKNAAAPKKVAAAGAEQRYRMIEVAAYYIAESSGFTADPLASWAEAEKQIDRMRSK
jgi:hypothetical protein